jgi:hypothetical protein
MWSQQRWPVAGSVHQGLLVSAKTRQSVSGRVGARRQWPTAGGAHQDGLKARQR